MNSSALNQKRCKSCEELTELLDLKHIESYLSQLRNGWTLSTDKRFLKKSFSFANFYETMSFVNALAWIANTENHHPDLELGYDYCRIHLSTHTVKGLSENDFICAAKIDDLKA